MPAIRGIFHQSAFNDFGQPFGDVGYATAKRDYLSFKNRAQSSGKPIGRPPKVGFVLWLACYGRKPNPTAEFVDDLGSVDGQPMRDLQGISAHVDCLPCFKNTIVTVSLGSVYEMDFINLETKVIRSTLLELGSALVMRDEK